MVLKYFIVDHCIYMYYITLLAFSYYCIIVLLDKKERKKDREKERKKERQRDRQTDGQTDSQADKQAN